MSSVELLFGPFLIGAFVNTILYGVVIVQTFIYYQSYKKDAKWIKAFVLYLFICETLNTGFDIGFVYEPLIVRYGTLHAVTFVPIMMAAAPIMTVLISTPVQIFIAWRIKIISGSKLLTALICFFAISAFIGGIATAVSVIIFPQYATLTRFDGAIITWLASSAAGDICITASLVWSLRIRKTGHSPTDDIVNRIIRLTVQTGLLTALSATADVVFFQVFPHTSLNFIWDLGLPKLYTNALLSTLNARAGWGNLNVVQHGVNVLFESSGGASRSGIRNTSRNPSYFTTGTLEMQIPRSTAPDKMSMHKNRHDLESGVVITKVVEHLEDPVPPSERSFRGDDPGTTMSG